ncbi:MAG: lipopolysaccharide biosynthesis regulator YciM [Hydrogenophaga sp.]|jgi:lipopolysaccharide biosynthesis regulator YciM
MDFDFTWLLWGLPIAFALGWGASRLDLRQWRVASRQAPKAYFRGLNHLLNEQQDQAIDAFIEAVQSDPDTAELHFALGNLFRRRGDYDRAVRVHEHLLARGDLSRKDRDRAQHALALDFLKAGLLDRAETALRKLVGSDFEAEALLALLTIAERSRDWTQASQIATRLEGTGQGSFASRLSHYLCEQADQVHRQGDVARALVLLTDATRQAPELARSWLAIATMQTQAGHSGEALDALLSLAHRAPQGLPLAAGRMAELARATGREAQVLAVLQSADAQTPSLDVTEALAKLSRDETEARQRYLAHLAREHSLVIAGQWLAGEDLSSTEAKSTIQSSLNQAIGPLKRYRCAACGFEAQQHFWQCPGCQSWDSYPARRVEEL